jgi:hypothetical protein
MIFFIKLKLTNDLLINLICDIILLVNISKMKIKKLVER